MEPGAENIDWTCGTDQRTLIQHRADTTGGDSGSAVYDLDTGEVIGIHTCAGCFDQGGANRGTAISHSGLYEKMQTPCDLPVQIHVPEHFNTIQKAINVALEGDEIIVAPGTYNEVINLTNRAVHLRSSAGPAATIISGTGSFSAVTISIPAGHGPETIIEGFTIAGDAFLDELSILGGSPTVRDCTIIASGFGSGIAIGTGSPLIQNCTVTGSGSGTGIGINAASPFIDNCSVSGFGTGISISNASPTIQNSTVHANNGQYGGGVTNSSGAEPTFLNCTFSNNSADHGGGMSNSNSNPIIDSCTFIENYSEHGGGAIVNFSSNPTISGTLFVDNATGHEGGAILNDESDPLVIASTFIGNSSDNGGGAICNSFGAQPTFIDCHFENNISTMMGGAIFNYMQAEPHIISSTFIGNHTTGQFPSPSAGGGAINNIGTNILIENSTFKNNFTSGGQFWQPVGGAIASFSMFGDTSHTVILDSTFESNSSTQGGAIFTVAGNQTDVTGSIFCLNTPNDLAGPWNDLGGNELLDVCPDGCAGPADLNCDGLVDVSDLLMLLGAWGPCADTDACPADINGDGAVDVSDLLILLSNWG